MLLLSDVTVADPAFEQPLQLREGEFCMRREDAVQNPTELKVMGRVMDYLTEDFQPACGAAVKCDSVRPGLGAAAAAERTD